MPGAPPQGWVLYDGECAFCVRVVAWWTPKLRRHGFEPAPMQAAWVTQRRGGSPDPADAVGLLTPAGEWLHGEAVYLHVARRIWWLRPLGCALGLPGVRRVFAAGYRWFARHRYCLAGACYTKEER